MSEPMDFTRPQDPDDGIQDFTKKRSAPTRFRVGGNVYTALVGLPSQTVLDFATQFGALTTATPVDQQVRVFAEILDQLLEEDSAKLLREMMRSKHPADMIEIDQLESIITYVIEKFGLRPTGPSSPSASGQELPDGGTNWTGSTPAVELIS
jgi:hypothetical protein